VRRGVCDRAYRAPSGEVFEVDRALEDAVLDRLNRLRGLSVVAVCAGHPRGAGGEAYVLLATHWLESLRPYLLRLSLTEYRAVVEYHKAQGWRLEVRRATTGPAPARWWRKLVDLLEGKA
jgi:hypothetical protein